MKFSIDEIEIIELGWPNYSHEEAWEGMFAIYDPKDDVWRLSKMKWMCEEWRRENGIC